MCHCWCRIRISAITYFKSNYTPANPHTHHIIIIVMNIIMNMAFVVVVFIMLIVVFTSNMIIIVFTSVVFFNARIILIINRIILIIDHIILIIAQTHHIILGHFSFYNCSLKIVIRYETIAGFSSISNTLAVVTVPGLNVYDNLFLPLSWTKHATNT